MRGAAVVVTIAVVIRYRGINGVVVAAAVVVVVAPAVAITGAICPTMMGAPYET